MGRNKTKGKGKGSSGQNRKTTDTFLAKNKLKADVHTTPSGLQYKILEEGEGTGPGDQAIMTIHQRIQLIDGTPIADTYQTGWPEKFSMEEAIEGLKEGMPLMSKNARFIFYIPPELAFGTRGAGTKIGPNTLIIIDLRLLDFY